MASALDRTGERALVLGAGAGLAPRLDAAAVGDDSGEGSWRSCSRRHLMWSAHMMQTRRRRPPPRVRGRSPSGPPPGPAPRGRRLAGHRMAAVWAAERRGRQRRPCRSSRSARRLRRLRSRVRSRTGSSVCPTRKGCLLVPCRRRHRRGSRLGARGTACRLRGRGRARARR